jgi:hypothetical protein
MSIRVYAAAIAVAGGLLASPGVGASEAENGLTINGLTINGLTINGLVINGLATNGTRSDTAELTAVILPDGSRVALQ